jgi:hypothetical protein
VHTARHTVVLHVVRIPEELAVARVAYRVQSDGHPVAENKIRERYRRLWTLVAEAIGQCRQTKIYDNSGLKGPPIAAQISEGFIVVDSPTFPHPTLPARQSCWPTGRIRRAHRESKRVTTCQLGCGLPGYGRLRRVGLVITA